MMKKIVKQLWIAVFTLILVCIPAATVNAAQTEDTTQTEDMEEDAQEEGERERTPLTFEIEIFTYEMLTDATQEDMPVGFTLGDWEYHGVTVKAGFTENSDMICVMGEDWETGYKYRFIYDPAHELFVPYFGTEIKDGYVYTIPIYEDAEIPYGFVEAYFEIQTVPMITYMREDAELTQEEIAVGSLSEDNYLVFLMMDESGKKEHYTYDLIDRTFQRALLQKKDAEKVTELNEVIDELHADIGELNAINVERMNNRLTIIGVLIAVVLVMAGVIVNLLLKVSKFKNTWELLSGENEVDEEYFDERVYTLEGMTEDVEEDDEIETEESSTKNSLKNFFVKKKKHYYDDEIEDEKQLYQEEILEAMHLDFPGTSDDEIEILDLDVEDL